ncbi:MAG: energy transducer TonB, partial [Acidobacteriaceae bacterium]|nr:energy transducer TonB [Acidobacteriaceae bacterium]
MVLSSPLPTYPEVARQRGIQGRVVLQIIIDRAGTVEHNVTVIESIQFLDESAVEAVRRWRFRPGRDRNGI